MTNHIFQRDCKGVQIYFQVHAYPTHCEIIAARHMGVDISHLLDPDILEAAQNEFYHKLINHPV